MPLIIPLSLNRITKKEVTLMGYQGYQEGYQGNNNYGYGYGGGGGGNSGGGTGSTFVLIVVLFILLVIVGASFAY